LNKDKFVLSFIILNPGSSALERELIKRNISVKRIKYTGKKDMPLSFIQVFFLLLFNRPDVIHAHLFDACLIGIPAGFLAGIKKRIYTRHNAVYHLEEHPHMVKYDKVINHFSTHIVAISNNVQEILIKEENVNPSKIKLIPHGFRLEEFENITEARIKALNAKYIVAEQHPVIGVISRYIGWKGVQYIIPAFEELLKIYPNALLVLANANGDYRFEIHKLLKNIPPDNFIEIGFEADLFSLYKLFDIFVHTPVKAQSEAFGQTYIEALASGIPSVFTLSGIACEFIEHKQNALVVEYKDSEAIYESIVELLNNKTLAEKIADNGKEHAWQRFQLNNMISSLEELYER
jgi:glycosyltransferase involved in cell wall biosynthesis